MIAMVDQICADTRS